MMKLRIMAVIGLVVLVGASAAFGQAFNCGTLGWYDDQVGTDCDLFVPSGAVPAEWWLVHSICTNVEGVTFKTVAPPSCLTFLFGGVITTWGPPPGNETTPWLTIGGYSTEIGFSYQSCIDGPIILARLDGLGPTSSDCCSLSVDPGTLQGFLCRGCGQPSIPIDIGVISYFQGDATCECVVPIALEESSWGRIKALYGSEE
jgi:hypothetical protein